MFQVSGLGSLGFRDALLTVAHPGLSPSRPVKPANIQVNL